MVKPRRPSLARATDATGLPAVREGQLCLAFERTDEAGFSGFIYDPNDLSRRFVVELLLDGIALRLARAEAYVPELASELIGDGCYGFSFVLPPDQLGENQIA